MFQAMSDYGNEYLTSIGINWGEVSVSLVVVFNCDDSRAVVMVIDSVNFTTEYRDVAALLYDLLASWHHKHIPLLIACNKQGIEREYKIFCV